MVPEELALQSLTADSAFSAVGGFGVTVLSPVVARTLSLPTPLVAAAGIGGIAWGAWAAMAAGSDDWRAAAKVAAVVDGARAGLLAVAAATRPTPGARVAVAAVAVPLAACAGAQTAALLWDRKSHIGTEPLPVEPDDLAG